MKTTITTFLLSLAVSLTLNAQQAPNTQDQAAPEARPNIVFFVADDLAADDIGPYGNRHVRTPNLDRLAGESLLFLAAFASSPTCSPSRASLLTGMYPFRNGAHANHTGIDQGIKTLPAYMADAGYRVAIAGKYHIGPMSAYPFQLIHGSNVPEPGHEDQGVLWTDLNMAPVDKWLMEAAQKDEPFMLVVNDHSPHVIWPEKATYEPSETDIPEMHIDTKETRKVRARYYTDITKMDGNLGKLLESLQAHGLAENTVVIFTADQGPQWAFGKWNLYDYGLHVPLLIKWPGSPAGRGPDGGEGSTTALVSLTDLLPTAIELAGGTPPDDIDGKSLLPLLNGERTAVRQTVFGSHTGDGMMNRSPMRMIRTRRYKYILNLAPEIEYNTHINKAKDHDGGRGYWDSWVRRSFESPHAAAVLWRYHNRPAEELYDVLSDPSERHNLAADPAYASLLEDFRTQMAAWREAQGDKETGPYDPPERPKGEGPVAPYIFK